MVFHSEILKRLGLILAILGIAIIVVSGALIVPTQDATITLPFVGVMPLAFYLGYAVTVGIYFVVGGVFVWIIGAGIEWKATKDDKEADRVGP